MEFKLWLEYKESDVEIKIDNFIKKIKNIVMSSMKIKDNYASFSFPKNYEMLIGSFPNKIQMRQPLLAAHTQYNGAVIKEGEREPKGKGAYEAGVEQGLIVPFDSPKDVDVFQKVITDNIRFVARDMGYLFEIDTFLYLLQKNLENISSNTEDIKFKKEKYSKNIEGRIKNKIFYNKLIELISGHAEDLASQIYNRAISAKICNGKIDQVEFLGGGSYGSGANHDIADIKIGCGLDKMGFSVKFTSEAKVPYRHLSLMTTYEMLGGNDPDQFNVKVKKALGNSEKEAKIVTLQNLYDLVKDYKVQDFINLLNNVLTSNNYTFPAVRNYFRGAGGAQWSVNIQRDFNTSDTPKTPLSAKEGAVINVVVNETYVKLLYKLKGGSRNGTYITFHPHISYNNESEEPLGDNWDEDANDVDPWDIEANDKKALSNSLSNFTIDVHINNIATDKSYRFDKLEI
jgi:hypothetical protein